MTPPHDILGALRAKEGTEQMAVFAEALIQHTDTPTYRDLPYIAAAYMLGRVDALEADAVECNGSARPMATAVLLARGLIYHGDRRAGIDSDLPF